MDQIFFATQNQLFVLFFFIIIGFVLKKLSILPDKSAEVLSKLETWIFVPALILNTFMTKCTREALMQRKELILSSAVISLVSVALANLIAPLFMLRPKKHKQHKSAPEAEKTQPESETENEKRRMTKNIYVYALAFSNIGFMGNSLVQSVFGDDALFDYMIFTLFLNALIYSYGMMLLIPKPDKAENEKLVSAENREIQNVNTKKSAAKKLLLPFRSLLNPVFAAIIAGAAVGLLSVPIPKFLLTSVSAAGGCMAPCAMLLTGFVIGGYKMKEMLFDPRVYIVSLLRLVILPLAIVLPMRYFLPYNILQTVLLPAVCVTAMPLGINTVIFPAAYGGDPSLGASMALVSHTLSVVTIPLMFVLLL